MSRTIAIDPLSRVEGHGRITLQLDDSGAVAQARFHVTQLRGFEKLVEGRPFSEMPSLMARICGICPVSHLLASAKACDQLLAVRVPEAGARLRDVLNLAQILQSHALSLFYLSAPDLVLGFDADPETRNLFGLIEQAPDLARDGIRLRQFGQSIIEELGGKRIHPAWVVPGGVATPLQIEARDRILKAIPEIKAVALRVLERMKPAVEKHRAEIRTFANFPSLFIGLVDDKGVVDYTDGKLRVSDPHGKIVVDHFAPEKYAELIGEHVEADSYLKSPYFKPRGYPDGMYRVGPLARMNLTDGLGTPLADQEWAEFRDLERGAVLGSFWSHQARLIEMLACIERIERALHEPVVLDRRVRSQARQNALEGIGVTEAPRGTLIHHYRVGEDGLMRWANLIVATGHNNLAMNQGILQAARHFVRGEQIQEGALNRVEAVIRAFDPCLSCSTHALGRMPLVLQLVAPDGALLDEARR